jgi:hypothetical protein
MFNGRGNFVSYALPQSFRAGHTHETRLQVGASDIGYPRWNAFRSVCIEERDYHFENTKKECMLLSIVEFGLDV